MVTSVFDLLSLPVVGARRRKLARGANVNNRKSSSGKRMRFSLFLLSLLLILASGCRSAHVPFADQGTTKSARGSVFIQAKLSRELISSAAWAKKEEIADLIAKGADPNAATDRGLTALHLAVAKDNQEAVAALLGFGAEPNVVDELDFSPLAAAVNTDKPTIARLLIAAGADPNFAPFPPKGPLYAAISNNNIEMIDLLVKHGSDLNAGYFEGDASIFPLIWKSDDATFEHLLKIGANPDFYLDEEKEVSFLEHLVFLTGTKKLDIALKYGADPNIHSQVSGQKPLHLAARANKAHAVELLLLHGAEIMPKDKRSFTPLDYAKGRNADEASAVLLQAGAR